jgi:hypothetical protein
MMDGLFYLYGNLVCNSAMTVCALWLLTDRQFKRVLRASHALIAAGAVVNVAGMAGALLGFRNMDYGHVWPGELVANFGTAGLLAYRIWQTTRRRAQSCPPKTEEEPLSR